MNRIRFAPSPTGDIHIGNIRIAVMNDLFRLRYGGKYILRIDDTDENRNVDKEKEIIEILKWLNIEIDESPENEGEFGPYRQSERSEIYNEIIEELKEKNIIYPCFCSDEDIDEMHQLQRIKGEPPHYDGRCYDLSKEEREKLLKEKNPVWRFRVLDREKISITDELRGTINFKPQDLGGDFVVIRSNGHIMYNLATVIDEHYMKISHVIRGEDHLSNSAKQVAIYEINNWEIPKFIHLPLILSESGKKLSKRDQSLSINRLKKEGFLPEAIYFYIGTLGWSNPPGEPIEREELGKKFDLENLGTSLINWNEHNLKLWNNKFFRKLNNKKLLEHIEPFVEKKHRDFFDNLNEAEKLELIELLKSEFHLLGDINDYLEMFYKEEIPTDEKCVELCRAYFDMKDCWKGNEPANNCIKKAKELGIPVKKIFLLIRCVVSGKTSGPPLDKLIDKIGNQLISKRWKIFWENLEKKND